MAKVLVKKRITFDGVRKVAGDVIEMSNERLAQMIENFKAKNLNGHLYIDVLEVEENETQETEPTKKTRRKRK